MSRDLLQCHECKEKFRREELISYATLRSKTAYNYCKKCYQEKLARERFAEKVCNIFGIKSPGPRIWTERKCLKDTYGYTDDLLIECLDYIYNVEKKKKFSESLCLINPSLVDKMMTYKRREQNKNNKIVSAINTETKEYVVKITEKDKENKNKVRWNPDDWLLDE